jgi:thioredoxin 1
LLHPTGIESNSTLKEKTMSEPIHVNDDAFEKAVMKSPVPVLVDFWAPWCVPCRMLAPSLETIARDYDTKVRVAKVNTDENPKWALQFGVQGIPTMLFVSEGKVVHKQVGVVPLPALRQMVDQFLIPVQAN